MKISELSIRRPVFATVLSLSIVLFGLVAYNLKTDTQHMGYVLREGETAAPAALLAALRRSNRLQDLLLEEMVVGRTGNDVLARLRRRRVLFAEEATHRFRPAS